jgi:Group II intron, maturase-specific domain
VSSASARALTFSVSTPAATAADHRSDPTRRRSDGSGNGSAIELRSLRGSNTRAVIKRLNPIIRGWAAYYRTQVSSKTFDALDNYLWQLTYKSARSATPTSRRPG